MSDRKSSKGKSSTAGNTKKPWSVDEDERLRELISIHGTGNWTSIADLLMDRTGKQCRERWHNHLNPGIKKGDWTEEEDQIIISMQRTIGNQWAKITKFLPGRTDNAVKNRFHATVRAKTRDFSSDDADLESQTADVTNFANVSMSSEYGLGLGAALSTFGTPAGVNYGGLGLGLDLGLGLGLDAATSIAQISPTATFLEMCRVGFGNAASSSSSSSAPSTRRVSGGSTSSYDSLQNSENKSVGSLGLAPSPPGLGLLDGQHLSHTSPNNPVPSFNMFPSPSPLCERSGDELGDNEEILSYVQRFAEGTPGSTPDVKSAPSSSEHTLHADASLPMNTATRYDGAASRISEMLPPLPPTHINSNTNMHSHTLGSTSMRVGRSSRSPSPILASLSPHPMLRPPSAPGDHNGSLGRLASPSLENHSALATPGAITSSPLTSTPIVLDDDFLDAWIGRGDTPSGDFSNASGDMSGSGIGFTSIVQGNNTHTSNPSTDTTSNQPIPAAQAISSAYERRKVKWSEMDAGSSTAAEVSPVPVPAPAPVYQSWISPPLAPAPGPSPVSGRSVPGSVLCPQVRAEYAPPSMLHVDVGLSPGLAQAGGYDSMRPATRRFRR